MMRTRHPLVGGQTAESRNRRARMGGDWTQLEDLAWERQIRLWNREYREARTHQPGAGIHHLNRSRAYTVRPVVAA
ncbi:hypothetical protein [Gordonia sihwensis]|uniref:hypothetical protein n=1 Tax=Gordonia sihwensis TaxID=173559 RepID=UPI002417BE4A|nr:hypothetical protein [Gordonia sihwensis]WFN93444.1 hypothetical protein P5P27_02400 [Gordonia sihwensis]